MCNCKSQPQYHRDDCLEFDAFGNKKELFNFMDKSLHFGISELDHALKIGIEINSYSSFLLENKTPLFNNSFLLLFLKENKNKKIVIFHNTDSVIFNYAAIQLESSYINKSMIKLIPISKSMDYKNIIRLMEEQSKANDILIFSDIAYFQNPNVLGKIKGYHRDQGFLNILKKNMMKYILFFNEKSISPLGYSLPINIMQFSSIILSLHFNNNKEILIDIKKYRHLTQFGVKSITCQL